MKRFLVFLLLSFSLTVAIAQPARIGAVSSSRSVSIAPVLLTAPAEFTWTDYPFNIYRNPDGTYSHDFDPADYDYQSETTVYYFNETTGLDANSGFTPATAKRNPEVLVNTLNATPTSKATFIFLTDTNFDINAVAFNTLVIKSGKGDGTNVNIRLLSAGSGYTSHAGGNSVYTWTKTGANASFMLDNTWLDEYNKPRKLMRVFSLAEVQSTPGTYYRATTLSINFRTFDSRNPTSGVHGYQENTLFSFSGAKIYCENVNFYGGRDESVLLLNYTMAVFNNCEFAYGYNQNDADLGDGVKCQGTGTVIFYRCRAFENHADGFSYYNGTKAVEIECQGFRNGFRTTKSNQNGSTIHEGSKIIRINGEYKYNRNRNIHDIGDGSQTWMIGCDVESPQDQSSATNSSNVMCGGGSGTENESTIWMDGCTIPPTAQSDINVLVSGARIFTRNMDISGLTTVNNGTLATY